MENDKKVKHAIIRNAHRLLSDAHLLYENSRYFSAVALGILALEEVGKYALQKWQFSDDYERLLRQINFHRVKQMVIGALIVAEDAVHAKDKHLAKHGCCVVHVSSLPPGYLEQIKLPDAVSDDQLVEVIAHAISQSHGPALMAHSVRGLIQKMKHACFYVDDELSDPSQHSLDQTRARQILHRAERALDLVNDSRILAVGKSQVELALERVQKMEENNSKLS